MKLRILKLKIKKIKKN